MERSKGIHFEKTYELGSLKASLNTVSGRLLMNFCDIFLNQGNYQVGVNLVFNSHLEPFGDMVVMDNYFTNTASDYLLPYNSSWNLEGFEDNAEVKYAYVDSNTNVHKFVKYKTYQGYDWYYDTFGSDLVLKVGTDTYLEDENKNKYYYNSQGFLTSVKAGINQGIYKVYERDEYGRILNIYDNRKNIRKIHFVYSGMRLNEIHYRNYKIKLKYSEYGLSEIIKERNRSFKKMYTFEYYSNAKLKTVVDYDSKESLIIEYNGDKVSKISKNIIKYTYNSIENLRYCGDGFESEDNCYCNDTYYNEKVINHQLIESDNITYNGSNTSITNNRNVNIIYYFNNNNELINVLRKEGNNYYTDSNIYGFDMLYVEGNQDGIEKIDNKINDSNYLRLNSSTLNSHYYSIEQFNERLYGDNTLKSAFYKIDLMVRLSGISNKDVKVNLSYSYYKDETSSTLLNSKSEDIYLHKVASDVWQRVSIPLYFDNPEMVVTSMTLNFLNANDSVIDVGYFYMYPSNVGFYRVNNNFSSMKLDSVQFRREEGGTLETLLITPELYFSKSDIEKTFINSYIALKNNEDKIDLLLCDGRKRIEVANVYLGFDNGGYEIYSSHAGGTNVQFINNYMDVNGKYRHQREILYFNSSLNDENLEISYSNASDLRDDKSPYVMPNALGTIKTYNEYGLLIEAENYGIGSKKYEYDGYGNLIKETISATDAEDKITTYEYNSINASVKEYLITISNEEQTITYEYDEVEEVISSVTINNEKKEFIYDKFYEVIKRINFYKKQENSFELTETHKIKYNNKKDISYLKANNGFEHSFVHNDLGLLKELYDKFSIKESYNYGLNVDISESGISIVNADMIEKTSYMNSSSSLVQTHVNKQYYDKFGRLRLNKVNNDLIIVNYDSFGEVQEAYDPYTMFTHKYTRDSCNGLLTYQIFNNSNVLLFQKEYVTKNYIEYKFNNQNNRKVINSYGDVNGCYSLLKTIDKEEGFASDEVDYEYELSYNMYNLLSEMQASLNKNSVDFSKEFVYNEKKDKIDSIIHTIGEYEFIDNYEYDEHGNLCSIYETSTVMSNDETYETSKYANYVFDELNRIIEETSSKNNDVIYEYDVNNNIIRINLKDGDVIKTFQYRNGKLVYVSGIGEIIYDNYGNAISIGSTDLEYDSRNNLSSITKTINGKTVTEYYYYNYQGIRYKKTTISNGTTLTTEYTLDGNKILKETTKDSNGNIVREFKYFYNSQGVCGIRYNNVNYTLVRDILGNVRKILNGDNVICDYWYDAWGNQNINYLGTSTSSNDYIVAYYNPFRYRGYYYDVETGLFWLSSRYYSPELCRFISPDDVEYLDPSSVNGLNLYAYCNNDSINNVDPSGHFPISASLFIGTIIIGAVIGGGTAAYSSIKKGDEWYEVAFKTISGAALGGMLGAAMGTGAALAAGGTIAGLSVRVSVVIGMGATVGGSALLGATNSFLNQIIDNDWNIHKVNGGRIASDAAVAGIKGLLSFVTGAWTGGAGLWNIPSGAAPGIGNFAAKLILNNVIGGVWKLTVDATYAHILGEECGWINVLESIIEWIF